MKKIILLWMIILFIPLVSGLVEKNIFFDDFDNANYASEGWAVGVGGITESGSSIHGTGVSHNTLYIDSDTWGNISLYDESWSIQYNHTQGGIGTYYSSIIIESGTTFLSGNGVWLSTDGKDTNTISLECFGSCSCTADNTANAANTDWHVSEFVYNDSNNNITAYYDGVQIGKGVVVTGCNLTGMNVVIDFRKNIEYVGWINITKIEEGFIPSPTFVSPTPDGSRNRTNQTINMTVTYGNNHTFMLYLDNSSNPSTLVYNGSSGVYTTDLTVDGVYFFKARVFDTITESYSVNSSVMNFTLDRVKPYQTLNANNFYSISNISTQNQYNNDTVHFNITFDDNTDLFGFDINITDGTNTVYNNTNLTLSGNTQANWTQTINVNTWPAKEYDIIMYVADPHHYDGGYQISDYSITEKADEVIFQTSEHNTVSIKSTGALTVNAERKPNSYEFSYEYPTLSNYRSFDVTSTTGVVHYHPKSKYQAHFTIYNPVTKTGNWVDFEGLTGNYAVEEIKGGYRVNFYNMLPVKELTTRSIGGLNIMSYNNSWYKGNVTVIDDDYVSGKPFTLYLNVTKGGSVSDTSASFIYNGSGMSVTTTTGSGYELYSVSFPSGVVVNNQTLINYSWHVNVTQTDASVYSFDVNESHYIYFIGVGTCNETDYNYTILNISYYDEQTLAGIDVNATFNLVFDDGVLPTIVQGSFTDNTHGSFCTDRNPSEITHEWNVTGTYTIGTNNYVTRIFTFGPGNEIISTNKPPTNESLYLILINASTTIQYNWLTTSYTLVDGILEIYTCADDGTKKLSESTPITSGVAVANIEIITQPYSYTVIIDGETYTENSYYACHLEPDNEATYYVDVISVGISPVIGLYLIDCSITKVDNTTARLEWNDNSESTSEITACVVGYDNTGSITTLVYEDCTTTGHSLTSTIPSNVYSVKGRLTQDGISGYCNEILTYKKYDNNLSTTAGINGALAIVLLLMAGALVYAGNEMASLLMAGVITILAFVFGISSIGWIGSISISLFLIMIGIIGRMNRK